MRDLIGKKLSNVEFIEKDGKTYGRMNGSGVSVDYEIKPVTLHKPVEAVLMDLDGTTVTSEEFWIYIIERTMQELVCNAAFSLEEADIPYVSGFTTAEHLQYCINKYYPDENLSRALEIYHTVAKAELDEILEGRGKVEAFKPTEGLKEFLYELKRRGIKIGLVTSGLDYKAIPEIVAVFRALDMGDPLQFYDAIITGGHRKDTHEYGSLGELAAKPHPWVYSEVAYMGLKIKNPANVIGIEDSAAGVMALRFAGFPVFGLNAGNITQSGLDALCYKKVDTLQQILDEIE
ncbi:MAG: HAD family phosphatase [Clostridia bacterium]|nr:HAD family phosphatase [Clostridia bacterium]